MSILGYWNIRGYGQPIRYLLKYVGEEFEEKVYHLGPPPELSKEQWLNDRDNLGMPFPNLPYYIDGDVKIAQTNSIMRYLAGKHHLCGDTDEERILADVSLEHIMDIKMDFVELCYGLGEFDQQRPKYIEKAIARFSFLESHIKGKDWITGNKICYADFWLYEVLDWNRIFEPGFLKNFPNLSALCDRFEALPAIKQYMASEECVKSPIFTPHAKWHG